MLEFYIHQIGDIYKESTYKKLIKILRAKTIASRDFLEKNGMSLVNESSFELNISEGEEGMYYTEDIHKDRVSLSDLQNLFIKKAIDRKDHQVITCFDYDYIAFAISKETPILPSDQTRGLALGEVQVKDKIDSKYIVGLILPFSQETIENPNTQRLLDIFTSICEKNDFPLDIYNYEGQLLKSKENKKQSRR